ncbi:MAG: tetratricopeptide repeat protein [Smithella sp.]
MATKISNVPELFRRFHSCETLVRQGKIASCLISFKDIIDRMRVISMTEKEKKELHQGIEVFLDNLSAHKKFKEIFGEFTFADTDLDTNLEFVKSMIIAQEQEIVQKIEKDEEAAEAQRLEMAKAEEEKKEALNLKAQELIDKGNLSEALEIIKENDEIKNSVLRHYNELGIQNRENKNYDEAVKNYSKAMTVAPDDENLHYNVARAYLEQDKLDKAEAILEKALKLNPEFKEGKILLDYVIKLDQAKAGNSSIEVKKSGGFLKKLFKSKK